MKIINYIKFFLSIITLFFNSNITFGQCENSILIIPDTSCFESESNQNSFLSGNGEYCIITADLPFLNPPPPFCSANSVLNNPAWISFTGSGEGMLNIEAIAHNCTGSGVQWALYDNCGNLMDAIACQSNPVIPPGFPFTVSAPITEGILYYLVFDGANGTTCEIHLNVMGGVANSPVGPVIDSVLLGNINICPLDTVHYEFGGFENASDYEWFFDGNSVAETTEPRANILIPGFSSAGNHLLCVTGSNAIDTSGQQICWDLEIIRDQTIRQEVVICEGDSVLLQGQYYTTGNYIIPYDGPNTCINEIELNVINNYLPVDTTYSIAICAGEDSLTMNGKIYTTGEFYNETVRSKAGCAYNALFIIEDITNFTAYISSDKDSIECNATDTARLKFTGNITSLNTKISENYEWYNKFGELLSTEDRYSTVYDGQYFLRVTSIFSNPSDLSGVDEALTCITDLTYEIYYKKYIHATPVIKLLDETPSNGTYQLAISNLNQFPAGTTFDWTGPGGVLFNIDDNGTLNVNFSENGDYIFCVSAINECNSSDSACYLIIVDILNNKAINSDQYYKLKNNPVGDLLIFQTQQITMNKIDFEIYNSQGNKVISEKKNGDDSDKIIHCEHLPSGVYLYKISASDKIYKTGKFIKI